MSNLYKDLLGDMPYLSMEQYLTRNLAEYLETEDCILTDKEKIAIKMRYFQQQTLDEIGVYFGVTRERVRQILCHAIKKLRHPSKLKLLLCGLSIIEKERKAYEYNEQLDNEIVSLKEKINDAKMLKIDLDSEIKKRLDELDVELKSNLDKSIDDLDLSVRSYNCLRRSGINTVADIVRNKDKLCKVRNMGVKSFVEILMMLVDMQVLTIDEANKTYKKNTGRTRDFSKRNW